MKGETPIPKFKTPNKDISSENERKGNKTEDSDKSQTPKDKNNKDDKGNSDSGGGSTRKSSRRKNKNKNNKIHETVEIPDPEDMPDDVIFKGKESKIVQGIKIEPYNYKIEYNVFYSPSTGKKYHGKIPQKFKTGYTAHLKAFISYLKYRAKMTESSIYHFLNDTGIGISKGSISNILLSNSDSLAQEVEDILKAAKTTFNYLQTDSTSCYEKGVEKQVHIFNNEYFSAFFTTDDRKRTTIIDLLRLFEPRVFSLNAEFFTLLTKRKVAEKHIEFLKNYESEELISEEDIGRILNSFSDKKNLYSLLYETAYIAGFHSDVGGPAVNILITDDASVYDNIALVHALCWIHEGRHFKKLNPVHIDFQDILSEFRNQFWNYYAMLLDYKAEPEPQKAVLLEQKFDSLFQTKTEYDELNDRIAKLYAKKEQLLVVLEYPEIPLHNNSSELEARVEARRRDVSFHTMSEQGTKAKDTMHSIIRTAEKLKVGILDYLTDRIAGFFQMQSLADLILSLKPP